MLLSVILISCFDPLPFRYYSSLDPLKYTHELLRSSAYHSLAYVHCSQPKRPQYPVYLFLRNPRVLYLWQRLYDSQSCQSQIHCIADSYNLPIAAFPKRYPKPDQFRSSWHVHVYVPTHDYAKVFSCFFCFSVTGSHISFKSLSRFVSSAYAAQSEHSVSISHGDSNTYTYITPWFFDHQRHVHDVFWHPCPLLQSLSTLPEPSTTLRPA